LAKIKAFFSLKRLSALLPGRGGESMKQAGLYALMIVGFLGYKAMTEADRDSSGAIVDAGSVDVFQIMVGDCFDDVTSEQISSLPGVPCAEPHDNEAYASFDVSLPSYPEGDGMYEMAFESCLDRFETFVGRDYESSSLDIYTLYPTAEGWAQDDREVVCAIFDMEENKLVGSMRGSGI